ncbi:MAG TPA: hypothetical protein ENN43_06660 [bacterium]|nr:hypothetical protein [bacterium]
MTDFEIILAVSWRIVEAGILGILVAGSFYICIDFMFANKNTAAGLKRSGFLLAIPAAVFIFIGAHDINRIIVIFTACTFAAACVFAFLRGPLNMNEQGKPFWLFFVAFYSLLLYVLVKEVVSRMA